MEQEFPQQEPDPYEIEVYHRTVELEEKVSAPSVTDLLALQTMSWRIRALVNETRDTLTSSGGGWTLVEVMGLPLDVLDSFLANQGVHAMKRVE